MKQRKELEPDSPDQIIGMTKVEVMKAPPLLWFKVTPYPSRAPFQQYTSASYWVQAGSRLKVEKRLTEIDHGLCSVAEHGTKEPYHHAAALTAEEWVKRTGSTTYLHYFSGKIECIAPVVIGDLVYQLDGKNLPIDTFSTESMVLVKTKDGSGKTTLVDKQELMALANNKNRLIVIETPKGKAHLHIQRKVGGKVGCTLT